MLTPDWPHLPPALLEFWTERHLCLLTTLRRDGSPHVVAVGVALDVEQRCAWVITRGGSRKAAHVRAAGPDGARVSAGQVDGPRWSSLEGRAVVLDQQTPDGEAAVARACGRYAARYRNPRPNPERVALRIDVERFLGSAGLFER